MIDSQYHVISDGVEKIVLDRVIDINKEKWTTNFLDVLKQSDLSEVYLALVRIKSNDDELDKKLSELPRDDKLERIALINDVHHDNIEALRAYLENHAIGSYNIMTGIKFASCRMSAKDILKLSKQDYIQYISRGDK